MGVEPKYFLILKNMREPIKPIALAALNSYLSALEINPNIPLISKVYFDTDSDLDNDLVIQNISNTYSSMLITEATETPTENWTEIITN